MGAFLALWGCKRNVKPAVFEGIGGQFYVLFSVLMVRFRGCVRLFPLPTRCFALSVPQQGQSYPQNKRGASEPAYL
jgi:hypothetical protein